MTNHWPNAHDIHNVRSLCATNLTCTTQLLLASASAGNLALQTAQNAHNALRPSSAVSQPHDPPPPQGLLQERQLTARQITTPVQVALHYVALMLLLLLLV